MIGDYDDDTHFCLKCHATILGLDNYVSHRKASCSKNLRDPVKSPLPSQLLHPDEFGLKADDFFFSLELRSSSKKPSVESTSGKSFNGILTRSKTSAVMQATAGVSKDVNEIQQSKSGKNVWIGGHQLKELGDGDNQSKLIKAVANLERRKDEPPRLQVYEESDDDSEEYDYDDDSSDEDQDVPPRHYTGGKWKPTSPIPWSRNADSREWNVPSKRSCSPPPTHTKGKWKPSYSNTTSQKEYDDQDVPSPTHTKGKWRPRADIEDDFPPPNHTKGKWKPKTDEEDFPPPTHTKGKWKPKNDNEDDNIPSPSYTRGKWKPKCENESDLTQPTATKLKQIVPNKLLLVKSKKQKESKTTESKEKSETVGNKPDDDYTKGKWLPPRKITDAIPFGSKYWCNPCNRGLASRIVYERHLKSELHFKRTLHDREFDDNDDLSYRAKIKPPESIFSNQDTSNNPATVNKKRNRKKTFLKCAVCNSKVNKYLIGKHLISHYHCRKGDITTPVAKLMVLENIYGIVMECPFQCSSCKFYCNTHEDFLTHWLSESHVTKQTPGYFFCGFCKHRSEDTHLMYTHLTSPEHNEVISVINRSVPIVIKRINPILCPTCNKEFLLNVQLMNHCRRFGHDDSSLKTFKNEFVCEPCNEGFKSNVALQRHRQNAHNEKYFVCTPCNLKFDNTTDAKLHRKSLKHRYMCLERSVQDKESMKRKCEYCQETFPNFLLLKEHLKEKHPEHKIRCPHCGANFTITQELTSHLRSKACKFENNPNNTLQCEKCPFSTNSASELMFHVALHGDPLMLYPENEQDPKTKPIPKYKCPVCDKFFPKSSLQCHIRLHTQERPYACKICDAKFARKNNLQFHERKHDKRNIRIVKTVPGSGERPFLCSACGASFKRKSTLHQHMQIHTGKLCKCPKLGCLYTARKLSEIKDHFKVHSDVKNFVCQLCQYKGKTKQQLNRHMVVHEETKKYQCSQCAFVTRTSTQLKRHARLHTGVKPFSCPHCAYRCNNIENLRKHVLSTNKHPGKCIYECKFCTVEPFQGNFAKDFKVHLITSHPEMFGNGAEAATYVAGIYEVQDNVNVNLNDVVYMDQTGEGNVVAQAIVNEDILTLKTDTDPIVCQLSTITKFREQSRKSDALDQMLPMFVIPKEEGIVIENSPETWNLVGRYDVEEESGTLIPFQSDTVALFQDHFD